MRGANYLAVSGFVSSLFVSPLFFSLFFSLFLALCFFSPFSAAGLSLAGGGVEPCANAAKENARTSTEINRFMHTLPSQIRREMRPSKCAKASTVPISSRADWNSLWGADPQQPYRS